jgi:ATP-dependent helicase HrpA
MRDVRDRYLPPDQAAFLAAEPPTGRIIIIAPTRAACETIELAFTVNIETFLERTQGARLRSLAASGQGFGIVAGTGTGKTLAVRPIAETILGTTDLRVGVVNREREATPDTPTWNVIIVTTGIARRWFQDGDIQARDTLVVDEIHQTSAELELCLALGKRVGCRFIWLSATVDPRFYARYLNSGDVLEVSAFDATKAARVETISAQPVEFLTDRFLQKAIREGRGIALFVPTRAAAEQAALYVAERYPNISSAHYHGGEPIRVIRPYLEGEVPKPFFLAMTAAGQSAINVPGLDTVIIDDTRFTNIVERGINVLTRLHLGANEILQMAGRVHGRVSGGRVYILSDRDIHFASLRATEPEFQLAGDSQRVALTCADLGVRADELDLPVPLNRAAYRAAVAHLESRGVIENGRLTKYGRAVEALPVERAWAELLVNADDALLPALAIMSGIESLHRMTREDRDLAGLVVRGSDHLSAYNVYAEAFRVAGTVGEVYGLPRHLFDTRILEWAEWRGVLVKSLEDAALAMASVCRSLDVALPTSLPLCDDAMERAYRRLVASIMPFDLVIDEQTRDGHEARVGKTSVCGSWGAVAGTLRHFADRHGIPRASIEGTQLSLDLVRQFARRGTSELVFEATRKPSPVLRRQRVEYFGFELSRESEPVLSWREDPELAGRVRSLLADALARGEARHVAVPRNQPVIDEVRSLWRRSGGDGSVPRLAQAELAAWYLAQLAGVDDLDGFRHARLSLSREQFVDESRAAPLRALPSSAEVRGQSVPVDYDVETAEDGVPFGVVRLRLPERVARSLWDDELPTLDRPLRFVVVRGQRGAIRADTLAELADKLDRPFTDDELDRARREETRRLEEAEARAAGRSRGSRDGTLARTEQAFERGPRRKGRGGKPPWRKKR